MLFPVPQLPSTCWPRVRSMLGAHLPQLLKKALKGCCCFKGWHIQNPSCFAGHLWMATYSNLQQDVFYKRANLVWLLKWEAFERSHTHTPLGKTRAFTAHTPPCLMGTNILALEGCSWASPPPTFFVCLNVSGLLALKQLEDLEVNTPGWSDLQSWVCLGPRLLEDTWNLELFCSSSSS